jgi:hypothetical protein
VLSHADQRSKLKITIRADQAAAVGHRDQA